MTRISDAPAGGARVLVLLASEMSALAVRVAAGIVGQTDRIVERDLPVAADTSSASPHESRLVQRLFDFMLTEQPPERVIGDKAYAGDQLDEELAERGTELIAPPRANRKPENVAQDRRPLQRYRRRWKVERTIAWIQHFRRLCIRWEKSTMLFQGCLPLACTVLLLRQVLG